MEYFGSIAILLVLLALGIIYTIVRGNKTTLFQREKEHSSELFQRYLIIAESVVETTVIKLNQTMVKECRRQSENGKLSEEDAKKIFETATRQVKLILGLVFIEFVSEYIGNFDEWLNQEIEKYVVLTKNDHLSKYIKT
jgi:hypothetical protein